MTISKRWYNRCVLYTCRYVHDIMKWKLWNTQFLPKNFNFGSMKELFYYNTMLTVKFLEAMLKQATSVLHVYSNLILKSCHGLQINLHNYVLH